MTPTGYIPPVASALAQSVQAEIASVRQDKTLATRRSRSPNVPKDEVVLSVETADAVTADRAHDEEHEEHKRQDRRRRQGDRRNHEGALSGDSSRRREAQPAKRAKANTPVASYVHKPAVTTQPTTLDITG